MKRCPRARTAAGAQRLGRRVRGAAGEGCAWGPCRVTRLPFGVGRAGGCRAARPLTRMRCGERDGGIEVGLLGLPPLSPEADLAGGGDRGLLPALSLGRGGRGGAAWRLTPPSSRPAAG